MIDKALAYVIQSIPEQAHRPSPVLQDLYLLDVFVNINSYKVTPDVRNHNDSKQIRHTIKPFFSNEFPVCHQMSYGIFPCNPFETIDQFDAFPGVGVAPLVHHRIDDRECHPIIYDAESENVNVRIAVLPVGPVHSKIVGTLNGY